MSGRHEWHRLIVTGPQLRGQHSAGLPVGMLINADIITAAAAAGALADAAVVLPPTALRQLLLCFMIQGSQAGIDASDPAVLQWFNRQYIPYPTGIDAI